VWGNLQNHLYEVKNHAYQSKNHTHLNENESGKMPKSKAQMPNQIQNPNISCTVVGRYYFEEQNEVASKKLLCPSSCIIADPLKASNSVD